MTAKKSPTGMHRALVARQEEMLYEQQALQITPGYTTIVLAVLKCPKCPKRSSPPVGHLYQVMLPDAPNGLRPWRGGTILLGTQKVDADAIKASAEALDRRNSEARRRRIPGSRLYSALIDLPGLPSALPFWCDRHGALTYPLKALRTLAASLDRDTPVPTVTVNRA